MNFIFTPSQNASTVITAATVASQGSFWYGYLIFFLFVAPLLTAFYLYNRFRKDEDDFKFWQVGVALLVGVVCRLALAPVASQPFDISVYATSARGWFDFASPGTSLGPTLPFTFFLYWVPSFLLRAANQTRPPGFLHFRAPNRILRNHLPQSLSDNRKISSSRISSSNSSRVK